MAYQIGAMEIVLRTDLQQFTSGMRNAEQAVSQSSARMSRATEGAARSVGGLEKALGSIHGADSFRALTISALRTEDSLSRLKSVALLIPSALGGISVALGTRALMNYADTMTTIRNRIAVVVDAQQDRVRAEQQIFNIAQNTRSQYSATANLYARTTQAAEKLGRSQGEILRFTEAVQKTNLISGASTQESAAGAIQLAQGLSSGRLQGDELRSILENNLELANVLAKELAGGDKGRLREMGSQGLLTANAVIDAVLRNLDRIDQKFAQTQPTIAQGFVLIDNAITKYVGNLDQAFGATASFVKILTSLSNSIPEAAAGLAGLGAVAASIFVGKAVGGAFQAGVGVYQGAAGELRDNRVAAVQSALRTREEKRNSSMALLAASQKATEAQSSIFSAVDPEIQKAYNAAVDAQSRATKKLSDAVDERAQVVSKLDKINRQISGADRALSNALQAEAPQSAAQLRKYFRAAFEVDAAVSKFESLKTAISDAKKERDSAVTDLSRALVAGNDKARKFYEKDIAARNDAISKLESRIPTAVQAIADAEQKQANRATDAVIAAEARKSDAINKALQNRANLIAEQAKLETKSTTLNDRVGGLTTNKTFADISVTKAAGELEANALKNTNDRLAQYSAAQNAAAAAAQNHTNNISAMRAATIAAGNGFTVAATAAARLGSSFMGFIGGPWGLAFTGLSAALGYLAYSQVEAANAAQRHKETIDRLPASIKAVEEATRRAAIGGNVRQDEVAGKAELEKAKDAARAAEDSLKVTLKRGLPVSGAANADFYEKAFGVNIRVQGAFAAIGKALNADMTVEQIQRIRDAIFELSAAGKISGEGADGILKIADAALKTQIGVEELSGKVVGLRNTIIDAASGETLRAANSNVATLAQWTREIENTKAAAAAAEPSLKAYAAALTEGFAQGAEGIAGANAEGAVKRLNEAILVTLSSFNQLNQIAAVLKLPAFDELMKQFTSGSITIDEFKAKLNELSTTEPRLENIKKFASEIGDKFASNKEQVRGLQDNINALTGKTIDIELRITQTMLGNGGPVTGNRASENSSMISLDNFYKENQRQAEEALRKANLSKQQRAIEDLQKQYMGASQSTLSSLASKQTAGGGGAKKSSEEKFDDRIRLMEAQARAASLTDRYRQLIDQLKTLKSDPTLAEETLRAIEAGRELPERAAKVLSAQDTLKAAELARDAKEQYGSFGDAITKVQERQALLNIALANGQITTDVAAKSIQAYVMSLPQYAYISKVANAGGEIARQFGMAATGMQSFDQAIQNVANSLTNMAIEEFLVKPIKDLISNMLTAQALSGAGGGGGLLGSLFGSLFGGGGSPTGGLYPTASAAAVKFHSGGTVGAGGTPITAPASLWAGAPKFHSGLNNTEFPAILQYGERVLTENDARRTDSVMMGLANKASNNNVIVAGGGVTINITNNSKASVSEPQEGNVAGQKSFDIIIDEVVAGKISQPGSRTRSAMASNFRLTNNLRTV